MQSERGGWLEPGTPSCDSARPCRVDQQPLVSVRNGLAPGPKCYETHRHLDTCTCAAHLLACSPYPRAPVRSDMEVFGTAWRAAACDSPRARRAIDRMVPNCFVKLPLRLDARRSEVRAVGRRPSGDCIAFHGRFQRAATAPCPLHLDSGDSRSPIVWAAGGGGSALRPSPALGGD